MIYIIFLWCSGSHGRFYGSETVRRGVDYGNDVSMNTTTATVTRCWWESSPSF